MTGLVPGKMHWKRQLSDLYRAGIAKYAGGSARVVPVEVKSGKNYKRHSALRKVLATPDYGVGRAVVLHDGNCESNGSIDYLPIYAAAFL